MGELRQTLALKIRAAAACAFEVAGPFAEQPPPRLAADPARLPADGLIAIGASTGGTEAIASILKALPANAPPIVVAQHIPAQFSKAFAMRLNGLCAVEVKEAADGDELRPGLALIAPGDFHMLAVAARRAARGSA